MTDKYYKTRGVSADNGYRIVSIFVPLPNSDYCVIDDFVKAFKKKSRKEHAKIKTNHNTIIILHLKSNYICL